MSGPFPCSAGGTRRARPAGILQRIPLPVKRPEAADGARRRLARRIAVEFATPAVEDGCLAVSVACRGAEMTTYVTGSGVHHPDERITNHELERRAGVAGAWIEQHLGIRERRRAPPDWKTSDLAVAALREAVARSNWSLSDIDLLLCATSTPDDLVPPTSCVIGDKLGISPACLDIDAACAGFVYGLGVASALLETGRYRRIALVAADNYTRFTGFGDTGLGLYWGDGSACVLLQPEPRPGALQLVDWDAGALTDGRRFTSLPLSGVASQDPHEVKRYALRGFVGSARTLLARCGVAPADLTAFVGHQANFRLLEQVVDALGIPRERHWHTVQLYGNRGAAGAPATLIRKSEEMPLREGELVLVTVFGAGFTTASALLRCTGA
jgi:3-oxoacyl-(acyl-carrier-protein) synthase III